MRWTDGFIAVDWGTTNRRAYRLDRTGTCTASFEDGRGILSVPAGGFAAAAAEVRDRLGDLPLLLAGMVGSTRGWLEVPYIACPAGLDDLAGQLCWVEPGTIAIVPGLSVIDGGRADVMRGEEVQLGGAIASGAVPADCFVGHPGTHNKWVEVRGSQIVSFRTVMTGELFAMLRERSMLAEMLASEATSDDAFRQGVRRGLSGGTLTAELFSVRASVLLGKLARISAPSFVSGLLIGADVAHGLSLAKGDDLYLLGDTDLTRLYSTALATAGHAAKEISGERAFLAGASALARMIK